MTTRAPLLARLCFVDIETTGLEPEVDQIIELGAVFVEQGVVTARRQWLVRPTNAVPSMVSALTGLRDESLRAAPSLAEVTPDFVSAIAGWPLVAHNAGFERSFLGERIAPNAMLDSCEVAQLLFPGRPSHSLDSLVKWLAVGDGARHRALDDAEDTFLMLTALCERYAQQGSVAHLDVMLRHLSAGASADRAVLCALLSALRAAMPAERRPTPDVRQSPDATLTQRIAASLAAPDVIALELESRPIVELALAAAASAAGDVPIAVSVPAPTFRELAQRPLPTLAQHPVCGASLRAALDTIADDELEQFGRAYLASWLFCTRTGELGHLSGFVRSRAATLAPLLQAASTCTCTDPRCFTRRALEPQAWVVISHEHALEWLEYGAPVKFLFVDADRLPDDERRRLQRGVDVRALDEDLEPHVTGLRTALERHPEGALTPRDLAKPAWLALHDALTQLSHAVQRAPASDRNGRLLERLRAVLEPPPPGFELVVRRDGVSRTPIRPADRISRRLRGGVCLLSSWLGGTAWAPRGALSSPTHASRRIEAHLAPTPAADLPALLREVNADLLVSPGPLAETIAALQAAGLDVSLGAPRAGALRVVEWRRDAVLPASETCVFHDVRDWRRAVLATGAGRVVLASPRGLPAAPVQRALRGLRPTTC